MGLAKLKTKISVEDYLESEKFSDEAIEFQSVKLTITLGEIYRRVKFEK